jgi:hypothetical protein
LSFSIGTVLFLFAFVCFAQEGISLDSIAEKGNTNLKKQGLYPVNNKIVIKIAKDLVSADINKAPMRDVLTIFSKKSGIKINIADIVKSQKISMQFQSLSIKTAVRRLLKGKNYSLIYGKTGDKLILTEVAVLPLRASQIGTVKLESKIKNMVGSQVLTNFLNTQSVPDNVKAVLLHQDRTDTLELQRTSMIQREQTISKLIKQIEKVGAASPDTINKLRIKLESQKSLKKE